MPRAKRPLSEADANASKNAQPKSKAPKRSHTYETTKKKHPNVTVAIAERFPSRSHMMRLIRTYPDLEVKELKELLSERGLPKTGRKDALVKRLEEHDEQHPNTEKKVGDDHKEALLRQPVPIGAVASEMGPRDEHWSTRLERAGPNGGPVYDEMGFELDYKKCGAGKGRPCKQTILNRSDRALEKEEREEAVKARVMGTDKGKDQWNLPYYMGPAWNDRVSKDLGIPFHKVGAQQFEEWEKKGFKPDSRDYENLGKEEEERLDFLTAGCALRK